MRPGVSGQGPLASSPWWGRGMCWVQDACLPSPYQTHGPGVPLLPGPPWPPEAAGARHAFPLRTRVFTFLPQTGPPASRAFIRPVYVFLVWDLK